MKQPQRRRYPRLATRKDAVVRSGAVALACEIRDYCRGGLYVAFGTPVSDELLASLMPATGVAIEFQDGEREHRVQGQVARALPSGLGVQVPALPDDVMLVLRAAAAAAPQPGQNEALGPDARSRIRRACSESFGAAMNRIVKAFFEAVPQTLGQASQDAVGITVRARFAQATAQISAERAAIAGRFAAAMRRSLQNPLAERRADRGAAPPTGLALIDDDLFEEWLTVSTVIHQTESDLGGVLVDLDRRYGALRELALDRVTNPLGPTAICRAFQDAIAPLELPAPIRVVTHRTFGAVLRAACPGMYATLNTILEALEPASVPMHTADERPARAERPAVPRAADGDGPSPEVPVPATVDYSLARLMKTLVAQALTPAYGGVPVSAAPVNAAPAIAMPPEAADVLHGVLDALPSAPVAVATPAMRAVAAAPAGAGSTLSAQLVGALDTVALPAPARRSIESAAGLIGRALEQPGVDAEIQALLRRLERPLLKLAMRDSGFLNSADHPARRMVDLLEQYAIATDERGRFFDDALRQYLFRLVDCVVERGDREPVLFERACDTLARLLGPIREARRARVARIQQGCEARERLRGARERALVALDARLAGRPVPLPVYGLLDAGWRQWLVLLETRGADALRDEALATVEQLCEWLGGGSTPAADFRAGWTALLGRVEAALAEVCVDPAEREACLDGLAQALAAVGRGEPAPGSIIAPPAAAPDEALSSDALRHWASKLRIGDWWLVPLPGGDTPMQLVWKSASSCAFANRSAGDRHELAIAEFSRQLERGQARTCPDPNRPLMERSEHALLDDGWRALVERALVDPVSGLPNRKGFVQQLTRIARSPAHGAQAHVVGIVEFDTLRMVWNACGVDAGEALVRQLADLSRATLGAHAVLGSLRDDTFALLLPDTDATQAAASGAVAALRACLAEHRFEHDGQRFGIGAGIGLVRWVPAEGDVEEALRRADAACVAARALGRHRVQVYEEGSRELRSQESLSDWIGRIDGLLEGSGLYLRAQRVQPLGEAEGLRPYYEILLGIEPMPGMETAPLGFVNAVERLGRSTDLDLWVVRAVLDWIDAHRDTFARIGGFAINLSPLSLGSPELLDSLDERLSRPGVPTEKLTFELTETAAIDSYGAAQNFIRRVRRHGCKVSLDDFGSGYASYGHLKHLRADSLKIDGVFVRDMLESPSDRAMVKSMHEVARSLGIRTVAEHVETPELLEALREMGIEYGQGYAIHKPCRIEQLVVG